MLPGLLALDAFVPPDDSGFDPLLPPGYDAAFTAVPALIGIGFVVVIALMIRRGFRYAQHGIDPTVADVDLQAKLLKSDLLAAERTVEPPVVTQGPARTVTERLAELDGLLGAGAITAAEHAEARARVLEDV